MANKKNEGFLGKLAEKMVRENKPILVAANELEIDMPSRDVLNIERRKSFQQLLWAEKHKFHKELAQDANRNKSVLIGQMVYIIDELMKVGKFKEAAEAILKLAKIEGYVGTEGTVNIIEGLSAIEMENVRRELMKKADNIQ